MFKHSIFSLPFILIAMIVAADGFFGFKLLFLAIIATIGARNFAMGFNRYIDRDIDIKNPRTANRPSVDGRLKKEQMLGFIIFNALVFIYVSYFINYTAFILSFPILLILASYSFFKKFSSTSHLMLGLSLGFAPLAGVIAVDAHITMWATFLSLGVLFWVAGFDLLYSLQDIDFDKENALYSIPAEYGVKATMFISKLFHGLTVLFWLLFVIEANLSLFAYIAIMISAVILFYEHKIVSSDIQRVDRAFFTLNGYLGIIFLIFIIVDKALF
jgi:4-hydroxybenzoate polyprenyltransferase